MKDLKNPKTILDIYNKMETYQTQLFRAASEAEGINIRKRTLRFVMGALSDLKDIVNHPHHPNWKRIANEFRHDESLGKFHFHLCEAILNADLHNLLIFRIAYPELTKWLKDVDL